MASDVDICNLALAYLGDDATVSSISPPDSSVQALHCSRFYPVVRNQLFERLNWGFAMKRVSLPLLSSAWPEWTYKYGVPSDVANFISVMPPDAVDDYTASIVPGNDAVSSSNFGTAYYGLGASVAYEPQPYTTELDADGQTLVLYTNQENAVLRYSAYITDTSLYSSLFIDALALTLASRLAGPILKGQTGADESKRLAAMAEGVISNAGESDANQRKIRLTQSVSWITGR